MLKSLKGYITQEEINNIKNKIFEQFKKYVLFKNDSRYNSLFSEEFAKHKKAHSVSWAIFSGFTKGTTFGNGLTSNSFEYGKGHSRPLISRDNFYMHIIESTSNSNAKYLDNFYQKNANGTNERYCYIYLEIKNDRLVLVQLVVPDSEGKIVEKEILFTSDELQEIV